MKVSETITENLKILFEAYKAKGGTQSSLAKTMEVGQGQISVWLRGGYLPGTENLPQLARIFGVKIDDLYRDPADLKRFLKQEQSEVIAEITKLLEELDEDSLQEIKALAEHSLEATRKAVGKKKKI